MQRTLQPGDSDVLDTLMQSPVGSNELTARASGRVTVLEKRGYEQSKTPIGGVIRRSVYVDP